MKAIFIMTLMIFLSSCMSSPKIIKDIGYKTISTQTLNLDLYAPKNPGPHPVVFTVHGGSWKGGDRWHMNSIAKKLAKEGFAVVNISYRFAPSFHYPAPIEDLTDAVLWAKEHEKEYNLDFSRINFWGYSAGSQISTLTALNLSSKYSVKAIINGAGPLNFELYPGDKVIAEYLGSSDIKSFSNASPINHITKNTPPVFSYHSTNDHIVDIRHAKTFHEKLSSLNIENKIHEVPVLGHIMTFLFSAESVDLSIDFLKKHN
mgnify:CR=1 FL=1